MTPLTARHRTILLAVIVFAVNLGLNRFLYLPGEGVYRESIEDGYASMARFFLQHPSPFGWNPLQYEGLPAHMWYLPVVPYSAALAMKLLPMFDHVHVYRMVVATGALLGPVSFFAFVLFFTRSRKWAFLTAITYSLFSVSYLLYGIVADDRGHAALPWRLQSLVKYAEGPHNVGLFLLPLALIACWRAAVGRRFREVLIAAALLALIPLTNWVSALALALCCLMMLLAGLGSGPQTGFLGRRIVYAGVLAYLFAAFWLTPTFVYTTLFNWPADTNYRVRLIHYVVRLALVAGPVLIRLLFLRFPRHTYFCFVSLCLYVFGLSVSAYYWYGVGVMPESWRYGPELELFFAAFLFEAARLLWTTRTRFGQAAAAALPTVFIYAAWPQFTEFVTDANRVLRPLQPENTVEYRMSRAIGEQKPRGRVYVTGGTRFRFNAYQDIPQLGGTFESGLRNRVPLDFIYFVRKHEARSAATRTADAILALRAAGVEYVGVHGTNSREFYHDITDPLVFEGTLERVYTDEDDRLYRLPFTGWANLVRESELPRHIPKGRDIEDAVPYVAAMDDTARPPLLSVWRGPGSIEIRGATPPNYWIAVRVSYDEGWRAYQDGRQIEVVRDVMGHIVLKPNPAPFSTIALEFRPHPEQVACTVLSVGAILSALWLARRHRLRRSSRA
ncbi:MAG: hypothetical protein R2762_19765 [Bryobacteraceae bacterium]